MSRPTTELGSSQTLKPITAESLLSSLSDEAVSAIQRLALLQEISETEAILRAIATEEYFCKERLRGSKILVQKSDGKTVREVVFPET
jgi:hypothetical protein